MMGRYGACASVPMLYSVGTKATYEFTVLMFAFTAFTIGLQGAMSPMDIAPNRVREGFVTWGNLGELKLVHGSAF